MLFFDGKKLKAERRKVGYTQAQLAELIGVSVRAYQKWEECASTPNATYLLRIIAVLRLANVFVLASVPVDESEGGA